ncbi:hypothetical protein Y032_0608g607 [Ancylostoma ceylanicum]|uniref:Uncharacterized protein n=1 Tax=Ancylostoma ceylanicum TaxID=53326 RepID=A0A016WLV3_9BILA|nr:hypothetical protein Y032_0608g607 [Ancylostoma ceylanicum]
MTVAFPRPRKARGATASLQHEYYLPIRPYYIPLPDNKLWGFLYSELVSLLVNIEFDGQLSRKPRFSTVATIKSCAARSRRVLFEAAKRPLPWMRAVNQPCSDYLLLNLVFPRNVYDLLYSSFFLIDLFLNCYDFVSQIMIPEVVVSLWAK